MGLTYESLFLFVASGSSDRKIESILEHLLFYKYRGPYDTMNEIQQEQVRKLIQQFRNGGIGRRDFLRQVVALGVGSAISYSLLEQAEAKAQVSNTPTTMAIGEEDLSVVDDHLNHGHPPRATTLMVGEEDVHQPPHVTTFAIGEEDPHHGPQPTTERVGEEDIQQPPHPITTQALGEEDHGHPTTAMVGEEGTHIPQRQPSTRRRGEEGNVAPGQMSTMAVGEEDNVPAVYPQQRPPQRPWNGWNRW